MILCMMDDQDDQDDDDQDVDDDDHQYPGKRIRSLTLYEEVGKLLGGILSWEHLPFMILYAIVFQWVSQSVT